MQPGVYARACHRVAEVEVTEFLIAGDRQEPHPRLASRTERVLSMLPNTLTDGPSVEERRAPDATGPRSRRRAGATLVGLMLFGGMLGIGMYRWVIAVDGPA